MKENRVVVGVVVVYDDDDAPNVVVVDITNVVVVVVAIVVIVIGVVVVYMYLPRKPSFLAYKTLHTTTKNKKIKCPNQNFSYLGLVLG